jgi:hypothetical protein
MAARLALALAAALSVQPGIAQADLWRQIQRPPASALQPQTVTLAPAQEKSIARRLKSRVSLDGWCDSAGSDEWLKHLSFQAIPLAPGVKALLVQAGTGCARSGQGANGAMWLIRLDGLRPVLLASPQQMFGGWLFSVQPKASKGYRDIVLAWHMSAFEQDLSYFRFDGSSYGRISSAVLHTDDNDVTTLVLQPPAHHP